MILAEKPDEIPLLPEAEALRLLKPHLGLIRECYLQAWAMWERLAEKFPSGRRPLVSRTRACFVRDHVVHAVRVAFRDVPGARIVKRRGLFTLDLGGKVSIRFKKLDERLTARNIPTLTQRGIERQQYLPGMEEASTWLIAGYVLDETGTQIAAIAITCPRMGANEWAFQITGSGAPRRVGRGERIETNRRAREA